MKKIAIFGATGSIGTQTLDVINRLGGYQVVLLTACGQWEKLANLAKIWKPQAIVISEERYESSLRRELADTEIKIFSGKEANSLVAQQLDFEICVNGLVGVAGLLPSYYTLKRGLDLALANKESLVLGGDLLNRVAAETGAQIIPVDSEHSAILQCLQGENVNEVKRLILTASGGPFRTWPLEKIQNATPEEALNHPTWRMGAKITIDSATLMNKGLEIIEAYHLFGIPANQIEAIIHPVSIVHSLVEFNDGSIKAQLGTPDMRLPIQHALTFPVHQALEIHRDEPTQWPALEFFPIDPERYPCLGLAYQALEIGGIAPAVLNGADEAAVMGFLEGKINFSMIPEIIAEVLSQVKTVPADSLKTILNADNWGRMLAQDLFHK